MKQKSRAAEPDFMKKADNGNRTRLSSLGSWRSTDELYPHVYRISITVNSQKEKNKNFNMKKDKSDMIFACAKDSFHGILICKEK